MALIVCGIDEAGYGPMLGPLCIGFVALRVRDAGLGDGPGDLWDRLATGVSREAGCPRGRVAVADSKRLKLASSIKTRHPLVHLERAVLSFARCLTPDRHAEGDQDRHAPATDGQLLTRLGASLEEHAWYAGGDIALPLGATPPQIAIAANILAASLAEAGVEILDLRCTVVGEGRFNEIVRRTGSKGEATLEAVGEHLRRAWSLCDAPRCNGAKGKGNDAEAFIACDRLGGRTRYALRVARELAGLDAGVTILHESPDASEYQVHGAGKRARVRFMPEAESAHLPVALASMIAKLVRELAMLRFNRYWCSRVPELRPTAGYWQDARRWLGDAGPAVTPHERASLVRLA